MKKFALSYSDSLSSVSFSTSDTNSNEQPGPYSRNTGGLEELDFADELWRGTGSARNEMPYATTWNKLVATAEFVSIDTFPGPVLALVPHADDETIGFGGVLRQLCEAKVPVTLVLVTDGVGSHPHATGHNATARRDVREAELRAALQELGATDIELSFWRMPDTQLSQLDGAVKASVVRRIAHTVQTGGYRTILTPWRQDPHGDHRALTHWVIQMLSLFDISPRPLLAEYFVWLGHQGERADFEGIEQFDLVAVDVRAQRDLKRRAFAAHRSQLGQVFDDPQGFKIPPSLAASIEREAEYFFLTKP